MGSVAQVRACAQQLVVEAKRRDVAVVLVGHVTKDGALAGPRVLEHVVDTVLSFEGERHHALRILRAVKHRFGSTDELGLFEMTGQGLIGVPDPSALFLTDRRTTSPGSVVVPAMDGRRPLLVEVQALAVPIPPGIPGRRNAQGLDAGRLALLLAVLQRHVGVRTNEHDVYTSLAGGLRVVEPGTDLAAGARRGQLDHGHPGARARRRGRRGRSGRGGASGRPRQAPPRRGRADGLRAGHRPVGDARRRRDAAAAGAHRRRGVAGRRESVTEEGGTVDTTMSEQAIVPMETECTNVRQLIRSLSPEEWAAPSGCAGWRVQDVVVHMACVFHAIAEPGTIEQSGTDDAEANAEAAVQARRDLTPDEAIAEYETWAATGTAGAARPAGAGRRARPSCRSATSASSRCTCWPTPWCSTTTATCATTSARRSSGPPTLPQDAGSLDATLEWMWAGLPQMCAEQLAGCDTGVNIVLDGPGGGSWQVRPGEDAWTVEPGTDPDLPTARSTAHDFVSWGTQRVGWRDAGVQLDDERAAATLDAINII